MAEEQGFEPWLGYNPTIGFQDRPLQPLGYSSGELLGMSKWWTLGELNSQLKLAKLALSHLTKGPNIWSKDVGFAPTFSKWNLDVLLELLLHTPNFTFGT